MKRIRTSESVGLLRLTLIVCALVATVGVRSGIADDKNAKVTVVYDHELPNVPGKSLRVFSSNMVPAKGRPPNRIRRLLSSMQPFSRERSAARSMTGRTFLSSRRELGREAG